VLSGLALTYTDAEFTTAKDSLVAALVVTLICIGIGDHRVFLFELIFHSTRFNSMN
jgi:multisubunit Na+/H+ antiporter MnhC subunit